MRIVGRLWQAEEKGRSGLIFRTWRIRPPTRLAQREQVKDSQGRCWKGSLRQAGCILSLGCQEARKAWRHELKDVLCFRKHLGQKQEENKRSRGLGTACRRRWPEPGWQSWEREEKIRFQDIFGDRSPLLLCSCTADTVWSELSHTAVTDSSWELCSPVYAVFMPRDQHSLCAHN